MKALKKDMRHGLMTLKVENSDDLWHLEHILTPGDLVKSRTMRKVAVKSGGEFTLGEKKPMVLKIALEKTGFDETTGTLRISGKIVEGPSETRLSSYHTLEAEPGTVLTIEKKRWSGPALKRIQEAGTRQPRILVCVMDREEADIALVRGTGIRMLGHIECEDPENREKYHAELLGFISGQDASDAVIVAGPGFEAGNFLKYARGKGTGTSGRWALEGASHTGINGINEVVKRSGERILRESRIGMESEAVEEVLERIKKDGLVSYGREEVGKALSLGAVETLLVSREKLSEFEGIIESCERMRGKIRIITADHQAGEQFLHLGGIAALLRFRTSGL